MTQPENLTTTQPHPVSIAKRMLQGAGIAFILIVIFLLGAGESDPDWGKFWMARPLIIVPIAGAMGGLWVYLMDQLRIQGGWKKALAIVLSVIGFIIALWLGTVLGLDGTMWN